MTVYVDILVVLNTLVNYFLLLAVKRITRESTSRLRILLGAAAGGLSSLLIFIEQLGVLMTLLKIAVSLVMVLISFKITSLKAYLKNTVWLFLISFVFGGLMFAVYMFTDVKTMLYTNGIVYFQIDMTFLIVCSVLSYGAISLITYFTDKKAPRSKEYYVTVGKNGRSVSLTALMDTGNNLREPFSGYPVIMADKAVFKELLGKDVSIDCMTEADGLRLIPVSTVSGGAVVKAFRPDTFKSGNYITDRVYIAESLTHIDEYKIILNINLEGELQNEKAEAMVK